MKSKNIFLTNSPDPNRPPIEEACGLTFSPFVPYGKDFVTLQISPNITNYEGVKSEEGFKSSNFMVTHGVLKTLRLDLINSDGRVTREDGMLVNIKLMNISSHEYEGQKFPVYELFVEEVKDDNDI